MTNATDFTCSWQSTIVRIMLIKRHAAAGAMPDPRRSVVALDNAGG